MRLFLVLFLISSAQLKAETNTNFNEEINWVSVCAKLEDHALSDFDQAYYQSILDKETAQAKSYEIQLEEVCEL